MGKRTIKIVFIILFAVAAVLAVFFVIPKTTGSLFAYAVNFSDVPATHGNSTAIQTLKDANIISGYANNQFRPDQQITRAETVAILLKAIGITATRTETRLPFNDVPENAWFFPMIQKGYAMGKIRGYPDGTFKPMAAITMPEAIVLTLGFFQVGVGSINIEPLIYDGLSNNEWYSRHMQYAKSRNLIEPDDRGRIDPAAPITRAQFAEIIYRMRIVQQTRGAFNLATNWPAEENLENFWRIKRPPNWEIFRGIQNSVIWKRDWRAGSNQTFFARLWPGSARVSISLVENSERLTISQYFARLKDIYERTYTRIKTRSSQITVGGRSALRIIVADRRIMDLIISLPNQKFIVMNGEYGEAIVGEFLKRQIEALEMSYTFAERPPAPQAPAQPLSERLAILRENILLPNKWNEVLPLFPDRRLLYTDAIGVGTGPVNYYYSREANYTIKLERNTGTILNIREGETYAF